jgi:thiamine biosynthesis lipoprotein
MTADAYATAFMVTGLDEACKIADKIEGLEYYILYTDENGEIKKRFTIKGLQ